MASKALLVVLGLVVTVSMGVGVVIGMTIADGGGGDSPEATAGPTATPVPTAGPGSGGGTNGRNPANTVTPVPPSSFDRAQIEAAVVAAVNDYRRENGLGPLSADGSHATALREMARNHSETMAREDVVAYRIDGVSSADRYERAGLREACKFPSAGNNYVISPEDTDLELINAVPAGRVSGSSVENGNEGAVAAAIFDRWTEQSFYAEKLTYENAQEVAVGVVVREDGEAFATLNIC